MLAPMGGGVTPLVSPAVLDLNAHILPAVHTATADMAESLDAARALVAAGVTAAVTPALIGADPAADLARADEARSALGASLEAAGVPLPLLPGAVVPAALLGSLDPAVLARCTVGDGGRWIMVVLPDAGWPLGLPAAMRGLEMAGMGIVIAHPERSTSIQQSPDRLRDLLGRGALVQAAGGSFLGADGPRAERAAFGLVRGGMVTVVASDATDATGHHLALDRALDALERVLRRPRAEVEWMLSTGPERITAGEVVRAPRLMPLPRSPT